MGVTVKTEEVGFTCGFAEEAVSKVDLQQTKMSSTFLKGQSCYITIGKETTQGEVLNLISHDLIYLALTTIIKTI